MTVATEGDFDRGAREFGAEEFATPPRATIDPAVFELPVCSAHANFSADTV